MNVNKSKSQNNNNFLTNFGSLQSIFLIFWRLNYFKYIFTSSYHCMIEQQNTYTCTHSVSDKKPLINPPVFSTGDMWLAFHADISASLSLFSSSSSDVRCPISIIWNNPGKRNCDRCLSVCSLVLHCNTICSGRCFFSRGRVADSILIILLDVWILDRCGRLCWLN